MLRKKEIFTVITPIPGFIPRQLAIDILHSHSEVITLNPLVLSHKPISAPQNAETDEYYSTWYEITERIQFVPGIGKMGASVIKFNGCFHDMPWGLQTHIYAPMNVDLRNKYRIAGNQTGYEPPEHQEMGLKALGAPADGLYLREDIEIKCNITMASFVKSQLQKAGGEMVQRIIKKAELLDAGVLQAMIEDGKLKTINPADRAKTNAIPSPLPSPISLHHSLSVSSSTTPPPLSPRMPYQVPRPQSFQPQGFRPSTPGSQPYPHPASMYGAPPQQMQMHQPVGPMELPTNHYHQPTSAAITFEMPGDYYHAPSSLQPPMNTPPLSGRESAATPALSEKSRASPDPSQSGRWSNLDSRPTSVASTATAASGPMGSPGIDHKGFASELATHKETAEEHRDEALRKLDPRIPQPAHYPPYNPQDYAQIAQQHAQMQANNGGQQPRYNYSQ